MKDQTFEFLKRWRALERRRVDLDFERSALARDIRASCESDAEFVGWCKTEAGLTDAQAHELLAMGQGAAIVTDARTWEDLGGLRQIRALAALPSKHAKERVVETAKRENLRIETIIRRQAAPARAETPRVQTPKDDAAALAKFVLRHVPRDKWTPYITSVVGRHANLGVVLVRKKAS